MLSKTLYYIQNTCLCDNNLMLFLSIDKNGYTSNLAEARLCSGRAAKKICKKYMYLTAWSETYLKKNSQLTIDRQYIDNNRGKWKT